MFLRLCTCIILLTSTVSLAETDLPTALRSFEDVDFNKLSRSEFVDLHEAALDAFWRPSMLLFSRVDPSLEDVIPAFEWSDAYHGAYGCLYDTLEDNDALDVATQTFAGMRGAFTYIEENPDLSVVNVEGHETFFEMMQPEEVYVDAMMACGILDLNADTMRESGLMDALMALSKE